MDVDAEQGNRPYEETLEAAKILEEVARSAGKKPAPSAKEKCPSSGQKEQPGGVCIGELFSNLVKMSPQEKIRIAEGSIGSLFKKYIGKHG